MKNFEPVEHLPLFADFERNKISPLRRRPNLSKSLYLKGLQCPKALWLTKYQPELRSKLSPAAQALMSLGQEVGLLAQQLYPGGVRIDQAAQDIPGKLFQTKQQLAQGAKILYEATFQFDNILIMIDILRLGVHGWEISEVKSGTSAKNTYLEDLALQYYVLQKSGLSIRRAQLILINTAYQRQRKIIVKKLFRRQNLTKQVIAKQAQVAKVVAELRQTLQGLQPPERPIGSHCFHPYECDFKGNCWAHIPQDSIFEIGGLPLKRKLELYAQGIVRPEQLPADTDLSPSQQQQVQVMRTGQLIVHKKEVRAFLEGLFFPLYFLDFETIQVPVPPYPYTKPFEALPFQFSVHWLNSPFDSLNHAEFLAPEGSDPRKAFVSQLCRLVSGRGSVVVYHAAFEQGIIGQLAKGFPAYAERLQKISAQVVDLMLPFQKHYVYAPAMHGSYSIKNVLPALIPELNYQDLEIKDGGMATHLYSTLHQQPDVALRQQIRQNLLAYCGLDTLAMVKIVEKLRELAS